MKSNNKKMTNDDKYKLIKQKMVLWYLIIILGVLTIVLSVFSLVFKISPIYAVICFVLEIIFSKLYDKLKNKSQV